MDLRSLVKIILIYIYLPNSLSKFESSCGNSKNTFCKCKYAFTTVETKVDCNGLGLSWLPSGIPSNTTDLDLSNNVFANFDNDAFLQFPDLKKILLDKNKLTRIPIFPKKMKEIHLSYNEIMNFDNETFLKCPDLRTIFLVGNKLTRIPQLPENLKEIYLDKNKLTRIPQLPENIEVINIVENPINIEPYVFLNLKHVKSIYVTVSKKLQSKSFSMSSTNAATIAVEGQIVSEIASGAFENIPNYGRLRILNTNITTIPARMIQGTPSLRIVELRFNKIYYIHPGAFKDQVQILNLYLDNNRLTTIPLALFNLSVVNILDLSWNNISSLGVGPILNKSPAQIYLIKNQIQNISRDHFSGLGDLNQLILRQNKIAHIADGAFRDTNIESLLLQSNLLTHITNETFYMKSRKLDFLYIYDNPLQEIEDNALSIMAVNSKTYLKCENLKKLPVFYGEKYNYCVTETTEIVFNGHLILNTFGYKRPYGMECDDADKCTLCLKGHYGDILGNRYVCFACPPGGFYQDVVGYVDFGDYTANCKTCPVGSFSPSAGARSVADCQTCPKGTKTDSVATLNACECLDNFHRTDRYGACQPCPVGVDCTDGVQRLIQGYWWSWSAMITANAGNLTEYEKFVSDMADNQFDKNNPDELNATKYIGQLPAVFACLRNKSCLGGGIDGNCSVGYSGWLCAACDHSYYELFNECYQCQKIPVVISIFGVIITVLGVIGYMVWKLDKRRNGNASMTSFLVHIKVTINFYQILGILSEVNEIHWPDDFQSVGQSLQYLDIIRYVNILSPKCIFPGTWNAYTLLYIAIATPFAIVMLTSTVFCLLKLFYRCKGDHSLHNTKDIFLSSTIMMLYLTYANTCSNVMAVGPWSIRKFHVTANGSKEVSILTSDYSIDVEQDDGVVYNIHKHIVYYSLIYVVCFPLVVVIVLHLKYKRNNNSNSVGFVQQEKFGLQFFFNQYTNKFWYWEVLEMYNKAVLALIANFKDDQASNMSYSLFITMVLIALHLYLEPMKNKSDQRFKLLTLCFIVVNVSVGAIVGLGTTLYTDDNTVAFLHDLTPFILLLINFSILLLLFVDLIKKIKDDIWDSLNNHSVLNTAVSDNNEDTMPLQYYNAAMCDDAELIST